jgi:hypothetical protein
MDGHLKHLGARVDKSPGYRGLAALVHCIEVFSMGVLWGPRARSGEDE